MRLWTHTAGHHRSYPEGPAPVTVDETDTYQLLAAARELEAHLLHEQARRVDDARALLAELYERDGEQIGDAVLDAQAEDVAAREFADRFLQELTSSIHPGAELLELAGQLDEHALGVWREAAASLVNDCPPSFLHLRGRIEEEQHAELRGHAHLVRTDAQLDTRLRRYGLAGRLWRHSQVAELRGQLATTRRRGERSQARLAWLEAKLLVIDKAEQARSAWMADAHDVLARGVAAVQVLAERTQQSQDGERKGEPASPAIGSRNWPRVTS